MVPMFLPVIAGLIARGAAVLGRFAVGAGRAIASKGGAIGRSVGKAAQRAGVSIQQGARQSRRAGLFGTSPFATGQAPVTGRRRGGGGIRRQRRRRSVSFGQAWSRSVRRGARTAITRQRSGSGSRFMQNLFSQKSILGRVTQNFGSAQANFKAGNNIDGAVDSLKVVGDVARPLAKGLAVLTGGAAAAGIALATFPKLISSWGASIIESKRALGEFNATYAIASGRLDIARLRRNVQLGAATGGNFRALTQTQSRLEEKLLPYQIASANALFKVVTLLEEIAITGVTLVEQSSNFSPMLMIMRDAAAWWGLNGNGARPDNNPLADFAGAINRGAFAGRRRPPQPVAPAPDAVPGAVFGAGQGGMGGGPREGRGRGAGFGV